MTTETKPKPRRKRVSGEQRRAGLLDAARKVFQESGLAGARTKRIAELAGTSEAILYRHFASKEELFEAAILEPVEEMVAELTESSASMAELGGRARRRKASYDVNESVLRRMLEIAPLLGTALFSDREAGVKFYHDRLEPLMRKLNEAFAASLTTWKHQPVAPEMIVNIELGTFFWVALQDYFGHSTIDAEAISHELTDILVRAL